MSACRSCGAPIRWARTEGGKAMPVDVVPAKDGNVLVDAQGVARVVEPGSGTHRSHFATCPNADAHRTREPKPTSSDFSVPPEEAQERDGTLFDPIDLDIPKPRNPYREDDAA